jgi:hypothetical protein
MTKKRSKSDDPDNLCQFPFADGRRCRMLRLDNHPSLCLFHARDERQLLESPQLGEEISATFTGNFLTSSDVNHALGKVFTAVAQDRLPRHTADTLAYLGSLMLQSLTAVKDETQFEFSYEAWQKMIRNAIKLSRAAWPGFRINSDLTPENASTILTASGQRASSPPAHFDDRTAPDPPPTDSKGTYSMLTPLQSADPEVLLRNSFRIRTSKPPRMCGKQRTLTPLESALPSHWLTP